MVASEPPLLPPGWLSTDSAIDLVGPHVFGAEWTGRENQAFDDVVKLIAPAIAEHNKRAKERARRGEPSEFKTPSLPASLTEAIRRKQAAFQRLCELCAYGTVRSALLLDDFTVRVGIQTKNWLDKRLSAETFRTGRATLPGYGPGWVMIDAAGLDAALGSAANGATERTGPVEMLRDDERGIELIHEAIEEVYRKAEDQGVKPPNVAEIITPVKKWLEKYKRCTARGNQIQELAGDQRYKDRRREPGVRVLGALRPVSELEI